MDHYLMEVSRAMDMETGMGLLLALAGGSEGEMVPMGPVFVSILSFFR
jgi:hypothetical protein